MVTISSLPRQECSANAALWRSGKSWITQKRTERRTGLVHCRQHFVGMWRRTCAYLQEPRYASVVQNPGDNSIPEGPDTRHHCWGVSRTVPCSLEQTKQLTLRKRACPSKHVSGNLIPVFFTLLYLGSCGYVLVCFCVLAECWRQCTRPVRPSVFCFCVFIF